MTTDEGKTLALRVLVCVFALLLVGLFLIINPQALQSSLVYAGY